jgi:predicted ATP-binding protein involved in virulence
MLRLEIILDAPWIGILDHNLQSLQVISSAHAAFVLTRLTRDKVRDLNAQYVG